MHESRLVAQDWRGAPDRIRAALQSTGLGGFLDEFRESGARLKRDVLFLGPERLYAPPLDYDPLRPASCFIVMPFSLEWSDDVHLVLAGACQAAGVRPVRGDDLFTPTDILEDIWQSINAADFVIADITGRTPTSSTSSVRAHAGEAGDDHLPARRRHPDRPQHPADHPVRPIRRGLARGPREQDRAGGGRDRPGLRPRGAAGAVAAWDRPSTTDPPLARSSLPRPGQILATRAASRSGNGSQFTTRWIHGGPLKPMAHQTTEHALPGFHFPDVEPVGPWLAPCTIT